MAASKTPKGSRRALLGRDTRRLQPKLRMVANGSDTVNTLRAELAAAVKVGKAALLKTPICRGQGAWPLTKQEFKRRERKNIPRRGRLKQLSTDVLANVFLYKSTPEPLDSKLVVETGRKGRISKATVTLASLRKLALDSRIAYVELGQPLKVPTPTITQSQSVAAPSRRTESAQATRHKYGADVLVGVIDVQGFDFSHPDFLDAKGNTRWVAIWDQGGDARPAPDAKSTQFNYGAEFSHEVLNNAVQSAAAIKVAAFELERQSQRVPGSHGTHVASIAAGNRGVCPRAMIAGVLIDLPDADQDRRRSFYDSTRIVDAVDYLVGVQGRLSAQLGRKIPLSINISLGTNGHAHDGSSAVNRWLDAVLNETGRCISVAAGNAGQAHAESDANDIGWVTGQIHTSGRIDKAGLEADIEWVVAGNGVLDISENELELWFSPQDRIAVSLKPPGMDWLEPIEPGSFVENRRLPDGSFVSIYNELYHPANGCNYIAIYLSPLLSDQGVVGVPAGTWQVRLLGREIRDGRFHGWIERDDPVELGPVGPKKAWRFPSFFSDRSNVDTSSVSSLACGERLVSVANLDVANERIHISSSQGPTRDGRTKPDIAANGTDVVAANGFAGPTNLWLGMTGTSMAAPFVTGAAALMLAAQPNLTGAQIIGLLQRTARPLPGSDYAWRNDAGFGRIDLSACVAEAVSTNSRKDVTRQ